MASRDLIALKEKIQRQIEALQRSLGPDSDSVELVSSGSAQSDDESDNSELQPPGMVQEDLLVERERIQKEIEELEQTLGSDGSCVDVQGDGNNTESALKDSEDDSDEEFDLPQNAETCLHMNMVYQEVLEEKLAELERALRENKEQQKEIMALVSDPVAPQPGSSDLPPLRVFLGNFMKPYFKDKVTGLGPPANPETRERMNKGTKTLEEKKIRRWEGWQKTLLMTSVVNDTMKRLLQPKLSKVEYLTEKMSKAKDMEKQILKKQIDQIEREIEDISSMKEDQLVGNRHDDHDWEKISNVDFEGTRSAEDIRRFWENYLHPSINKSCWKEDEIEKLRGIVEKHNCCHWDRIADELGTNRTAFMCLQTHQRYIFKTFKKSSWTKEEDQVLKELVEKMRIGNFIPYTQISYFMEGREAGQLIYRWTQVLDPTLKKGHWSKQEDELLLKAVEKYGVKDWWKIRSEVPGRTDGQCRDRYLDCLSEDVKKGRWSPEEEALLIRLVQKYGAGRWAKIAAEIPNRVDGQCLQKWKAMTGYGSKKKKYYKSHKQANLGNQRKKNGRKTSKRKRVNDEDEESMTSEEGQKEEMVFMDGEEEQAVLEPESGAMEAYVLPDIKEWLPKESDVLLRLGPRVVRTRKTKLTNQMVNPPDGAWSTILDRFGCPCSDTMGTKPQSKKRTQEDDIYKKNMIEVSLVEVRKLLEQNAAFARAKSIKNKRARQREDSQQGAVAGRVMEAGYKQDCNENSTWQRACKTALNNELMLAVTPWVGNVLMPMPSRQGKRREADVVREKAEAIGLTSTPVFMFFLKVLHIDVEGCKKVIEARKTDSCSPKYDKVAVAPSHRPMSMLDPYKKPTVAQILFQKRQESKRREELLKSQLVLPYVVVPQTLVIRQPLLQGMAHVAAPVSIRPPNDVGQGAGLEKKRVHKPRKKALAVEKREFDKSEKCSPSHKRARLQNISPKSGLNDRVSLAPTPITWIVTPSGLLPLNGVGTADPCAVTKEGLLNHPGVASPTPAVLNQQASIRFSVQVNHGAELPSATPLPAAYVTPAIPSMVVRTAPKPATKTVTAAGSPAEGVVCLVSNVQGAPPTTAFKECAAEQHTASLSQVPQHIIAASSSIISTAALPLPQPLFQVFQHSGLATPTGSSACPLTSTQSQLPVTHSTQRVIKILQPSKGQMAPNPTPHPVPSSEPAGFDSNLIFLEETPQVREWIKGTTGICLPQLDVTLPYLPPFVSNLSTLTALLRQKRTLEMCALRLVPPRKDGEEVRVKAVRELVATRLSSNPAYLLLKARFLSCFTLPAFLATVHPQQKPMSPSSFSLENSEEEEGLSSSRQLDAESDLRMHKVALLNLEKEGGAASQFTGIFSRRRSRIFRKV